MAYLGQSFFDDPWGSLKVPMEEQQTVEPESGWTGEGYGYGGGAKTTPTTTPATTTPAAPVTGISSTGKLLMIAGGAFALMMILGGKKR